MDMSCKNINGIYGFCNENVHNIIEKMGQGRFSDHYIGDDFFDGSEYRIFEGQDCIQYLQEYVPLHLPQIEYVLNRVIDASREFFTDTISIMDLGSGPATVPLAFCRFFIFSYKHKFKITTVEPSEGFNDMINIFKATNTNEFVQIVNNLKYKLFEDNFMNDESVFRRGYNWIIMANSISAIGKGRTFKQVNDILGKFIVNVLRYSKQVILTIIESSSQQYFYSPTYLSRIGKMGFKDLRIIKTVSPINWFKINVPEIRYCKFYKTDIDNPKYSPYINSKSLLLELR
ncbi:MAG: hypothetical protein U9N41_08970 [Euryarchaeota archaeon]|nr:hypothetical protein [Euryarchaeota archaeon]